MGTVTLYITHIEQLFNITRDASDKSLAVGQDVRLYGSYKRRGKPTQSIILRCGRKDTDLAMKKSEKWLLEILLPPNQYAVFAELCKKHPTACTFDPSDEPNSFQIVLALPQK